MQNYIICSRFSLSILFMYSLTLRHSRHFFSTQFFSTTFNLIYRSNFKICSKSLAPAHYLSLYQICQEVPIVCLPYSQLLKALLKKRINEAKSLHSNTMPRRRMDLHAFFTSAFDICASSPVHFTPASSARDTIWRGGERVGRKLV